MSQQTPPGTPAKDDPAEDPDICDSELLRAISQKEDQNSARSAWGAFYSRHARFLYGACLRAYGHKLGDAGVQDLISETFLRVYKTGAASFTPGSLSDPDQKRRQVRAWLAAIAEHLAFDKLRGRKKAGEIQLSQTEWQDMGQERDTPATEVIEQVCHQMQAILNEKEQDVIRTTYLWNAPGKDYQKLPASELAALAQRCGTTPENIRKIRERAMKKLKSALEPVMAHISARTPFDE